MFYSPCKTNLPTFGGVGAHRRLGVAMAVYAIPLFLVGMWVSFSQFALRVEAGELVLARAMFLPPFTDMLVFPFLFGFAVYRRGRPELHKRLMVVTTAMLLVAGAMRITMFGDPPPPVPGLLIWLSPIALALVRDWAAERRVHAVYALALLLMPIFFFRILLVDSAIWIGFTDWVIEGFLS